MPITVNATWIVGILLAIIRVAAFAVASPILAKVMPKVGRGAAQILDPSGDHTSGVLVSMFNMTALAILMVVGGDRLMVRGLALSIQAVPLAGVARMPSGLATMLIDSLGALMVSGVALAAPVLAAIFLADLALAALARFAPQTNAFVIGLPLKLLISLMLLGAIVAIFP